MRQRLVFFIALIAALCLPLHAAAQTSPFVPDALYRDLADEISGDRSFENVRHLTHFHRTGGSRDFFAAAEWIRGAAVAAGLEDVHLVKQAARQPGWSCTFGEAWLLEPERTKLAAYDEVRVSIADNSRTTHVTAELIDVGVGTAEADYAGKDVKGKVVLATGAAAAVHEQAVWKRGALGVISAQNNRLEAFDAPDQVGWGRLPYEAHKVEGVADGTAPTFAVLVSPRRARWLQKRIAAPGAAIGKVKIDIDADFDSGATQAYVEGWIRGTGIHDQQVVLTAHIQEEMTSANDDGSGCATCWRSGAPSRASSRTAACPGPSATSTSGG